LKLLCCQQARVLLLLWPQIKEFIALLSLSGDNTDELEKKMWADEDFFKYFVLNDQAE
jgi:hypothetical protein